METTDEHGFGGTGRLTLRVNFPVLATLLNPYHNPTSLCFPGKKLATKKLKMLKKFCLPEFCAFCAFLRPSSSVAASAALGASVSIRG